MQRAHTPPALRLLFALAACVPLGTAAWAAPPGGGYAPVVSGPALPPIIAAADAPAVPTCHCEASSALPAPLGPDGAGPHCLPAPSGLPFGASTRAWFGAQVANGQAARMVLYQYDFLPDKAALAPAGRRKLARMAPLIAATPYPLIVQPSGSKAALDRARRRQVIEELGRLSWPVPAERVVIAPPPSRGLQGAEIEGLHAKFLELMGGLAPAAAAAPPGQSAIPY